MSRTDDYGWTDTHPENQRPDAGPSVVDRLAELPSRLGLSREAAHREMERFRGVAEYEIRKIFGQHSALQQPVEPASPRKSKRRDTHSSALGAGPAASQKVSFEPELTSPTVGMNQRSPAEVLTLDVQPSSDRPAAQTPVPDTEATPRD
jgi:hypothetical protein